jgi:hypothetical protein
MKSVINAIEEYSHFPDSSLDTVNLILEYTGNDEYRMIKLLSDIESHLEMETTELSISHWQDEADGVKRDHHYTWRKERYYRALNRIKKELRAKLALNMPESSDNNAMLWLRSEVGLVYLVERLIDRGYISNRSKRLVIASNFKGFEPQEVEAKERMDWVQSQRLLILFIKYLMSNGWIAFDSKPWVMTKNHFTKRGKELNSNSLTSEFSQLNTGIINVDGWDAMKLILEPLEGFG